MRALLWQALFFRLLHEQKKLFLIAGLTVSLGVALALGIRLGTQSAVKSLENLVLPKDDTWSDTIVASTPEAKLFLRESGFKLDGLIFSSLEGLIKPTDSGNDQTQVRIQVLWGVDPSHTAFFNSEKLARGEVEVLTGVECLKKLRKVSKFQVADEQIKIKLAVADHPLLANCRNFIVSPIIFATSKLQNLLQKAPLNLALPLRSAEEKRNYREFLEIASLFPGIEVESNKKRITRLEDVTVSFRTNLQLMGFIALFIGFAMVHHIFSLIVAKQSKTLATLSALGVNARRQATILLCLSLVLASIASTFGTLLGIFTGRILGEISSLTIKNLYDTFIDPQSFSWNKTEILYGFALGFSACLAGCIHPILKIKQLPLAQIIRDGSFESHDLSLTPKQNFVLLITIIFISVAFLNITLVWNRIPITPLFSCLGFLVAAALVARQVGHFLYFKSNLNMTRKRWSTQLRLFLAPQTAVVIQILTLTFTLTFGVKGMAESFRKTLADWSTETLKADFWFRTVGGAGIPLPEQILTRLEQLKTQGVKAIDRLSIGPATLTTERIMTEKPVLIAAARFDEQSKVSPMKLLLPVESNAKIQAELAQSIAQNAEGCAGTRDNPCRAYISEPISVHFGLNSPLETLICPRYRSQNICFNVTAVYQDFGSDQGVILTDERVFERLLLNAPKPSFTNIYVTDNASSFANRISTELNSFAENSGGTLAFERLDDLQKRILQTFDNTFRITDALYVLCGIIAVIATVSSLNLQILLRNREWSILWTLGISNKNIQNRFAWWSAVMAFLAAMISIFGGYVLSSILVYSVNYYSFGYSLQLVVPWQLPLIVLAVATLSGYISGRLQTRALTENTNLKNLIRE